MCMKTIVVARDVHECADHKVVALSDTTFDRDDLIEIDGKMYAVEFSWMETETDKYGCLEWLKEEFGDLPRVTGWYKYFKVNK